MKSLPEDIVPRTHRHVPKHWGWEEILDETKKVLHFLPGGETSFHFHDLKDEDLHAIDKPFRVHFPREGKLYTIPRGEHIRILRKTPHRILFPEGGDILEISPRDDTSIRLWDKAGRAPKHTLIVFDVDGVLTETRSPLSASLASSLLSLSKDHYLGFVSGMTLHQMEKQLALLTDLGGRPEKFFFLPCSGSQLWYWHDHVLEWQNLYSHFLSPCEKEVIFHSLLATKRFLPGYEGTYIQGDLIEDRETQVTFSALGNQAEKKRKLEWDPNQKKREQMVLFLRLLIPQYEVMVGGTTSIDVLLKGINKGYGVYRLSKFLGVPKEEVLFFGNQIEPGQNDYSVREEGFPWVEVLSPSQTENLLWWEKYGRE